MGQTINVVILASGNGTNMENLVLSLHNKTITQAMRQNGVNLTKNSTTKDKAPLQTSPNAFIINSETIQDSMLAKDPLINVLSIVSDNKDAHALHRAKRLGLPTQIIDSTDKSRQEFDKALLLYLTSLEREYGLNCILLAGFMRILGAEFLDRLKHIRILNIHPSFLPLHKGLNGIEKSYADSNDFGGVSVHFVTKELDSGMIILQEKIQKIPNESLEDFTQRVHDVEYRLYPQAFLKAFAQGIHNV
ncbi:formyltransferase family protein [Helicobacter bilis]|uniref:formyltransferase family protein n=1 Tax=Helicobacter bilis TaxID=37372 RepID=UPI000CF145D0|nr:formyltransferase family protein [Helicobacter bilis]